MRFSNGYGSITRMKGNRRNPYRVRKTISCELVDGKAIQKMATIGYYPTKDAAIEALVEYNKNPYDIGKQITFNELYERWSTEHFPKISHTNAAGYRSAYVLCVVLYDMPFADIHLSHLQGVIDNCGKNYPMLVRIKVLFSQLYKYARKYEICMTDRSKDVDVIQYKDRNPNAIGRQAFTEEEIRILWDNTDDEYAALILIMIYTGLRLGELRELTKDNIHLSERYLYIPKSKTLAGIRQVPICEKIVPLVENQLHRFPDDEYFIHVRNGKIISDVHFRNNHWNPTIEKLHLNKNHRPHDTRHTCVSLLAAAHVEDKYIKKIVGHSSTDVTESVYTHIDIKQLIEVINCI